MNFRKIHIGFLLVMLLSAAGLFAQNDSSIVKFVNPPSVATPKGYSHAAMVDLGTCRMLILSGEVPFDKDGKLVGKDDFAKQTEQVFINIKNIITDLGGTMKDIVKLDLFLLDVKNIQTLRNVRDKYINLQNPPTSTLVEVKKLFRDDVLIEVAATAILPKE